MVAENSIPQKQIIACAAKSKLCSQHGKHKGPYGESSSPCRANIKMIDTIGNEKHRHLRAWKIMSLRCSPLLLTQTLLRTRPQSPFTNKDTVKQSLITLSTKETSENIRKQFKNDTKLVIMISAATKMARDKLCVHFAILTLQRPVPQKSFKLIKHILEMSKGLKYAFPS